MLVTMRRLMLPAASEGKLDCIKVMLSLASCAYAVPDHSGLTPEDDAKTNNQADVADFLSLLRWESRTDRKQARS